MVPGLGSFTQAVNWTFSGSALPAGLVVNTDTITGGPKNATMVAANVNVTGGYLQLKVRRLRSSSHDVSRCFVGANIVLQVPGGQTGSTIKGGGVMTSISTIRYASVRTYAIYSSVSGTCVGTF